MTILTILLFISCILFLIGYRKERSRRIALENHVKDIQKTRGEMYDEAMATIKRDNEQRLVSMLGSSESAKPKAMTAPIVKRAAREQLYHDAFKALADGAISESAKKDAKQYLLEDAKPKIPRGYKRNNGLKAWKLKPTDVIDILFRDGQIWKEEAVRGWDWKHEYGCSDIIAYKPVKPNTMKRKKK